MEGSWATLVSSFNSKGESLSGNLKFSELSTPPITLHSQGRYAQGLSKYGRTVEKDE